MCELFGVSSQQPVHINNYLKSFYRHCNMHPHGWGLALMNNKQPHIEKEPIEATESRHLKEILKNPIYTKSALAHIRLATMGNMDVANCHPFISEDNNGRKWVLIHNGTIFKCDLLNKYKKTQDGNTDSERILMYIIDRINYKERQQPLSDREQFNCIYKIISKLAEGNKLNLIISNGTYTYAHSNTRNSLHYQRINKTIYFSTQKLNDKPWKLVPLNTVFALKDGEIIYKGKSHKYTYKLTEDQFNYIMNHVNPSLRESIINNFGEMHEAEFLNYH